jgi:hypothetical protein
MVWAVSTTERGTYTFRPRKRTGTLHTTTINATGTLIKKEKKTFLIYNEIQMGSGAKSYVRKGFLIYREMHKYFYHL